MEKVILGSDGGSRKNGDVNAIGAFGTVLMYKGNIKEITTAYKGVTNNQMELAGVIVGLGALKFSCEVEIYTDSKYVVDAINKHWIDSWKAAGWNRGKNQLKNRELWRELDKLMQKHKCNIHWVKGHKLIQGDKSSELNHRCDELCNMSMDAFDDAKPFESFLKDYNIETEF